MIDGFCYRNSVDEGRQFATDTQKISRINESVAIRFMLHHSYDEMVGVSDARRLSLDTDAIIYHIQAHRQFMVSKHKSYSGEKQTNEYSSRFFGRNFRGLKERGIALLQMLSSNDAVLKEVDHLPEDNTMIISPKEGEINRGNREIILGSLLGDCIDSKETYFKIFIGRATKEWERSQVSCEFRIGPEVTEMAHGRYISQVDTSGINMVYCELIRNVYKKILSKRIIEVTLKQNQKVVQVFSFDTMRQVQGYLVPSTFSRPYLPQKGSFGVWVCVRSFLHPVNKIEGSMYLEFVEHHLSLGVEFIYMATDFHPKARSFELLEQLMKPYIKNGKLLLTSTHSLIDIPDSLISNHLRNMVLNIAKGLASKLIIFNSITNLYIPKQDGFEEEIAVGIQNDWGRKSDLQPEIDSAPSTNNPGPLCHDTVLKASALILPSQSLLDRVTQQYDGHYKYDYSKPFYGERYSLVPSAPVSPNELAYVVSVPDVVMIEDSKNGGQRLSLILWLNNSLPCYGIIDEVHNKVNKLTGGVVYRFLTPNNLTEDGNLQHLFLTENSYHKYYFKNVMKGLHDHGLVLPFIFPIDIPKTLSSNTIRAGEISFPDLLKKALKK